MIQRVHQDWLLTPHRLAIHEPTATAVIADVHLGYREARQQAGDAVPLLGMRTQLEALRKAREQYSFQHLFVAGDLFERSVQSDLLVQWLAALADWQIEFAGLVPGNHDRDWESFTERIAIFPDGVSLGGWRVVHGDQPSEHAALVLGHWHPVIEHAGRRSPCYLVGPNRLVLPAFSGDAGGLAVHCQQGWRDCQCLAISGNFVVEAHASAAKNPRQRLRGFRGKIDRAGSAVRYQ